MLDFVDIKIGNITYQYPVRISISYFSISHNFVNGFYFNIPRQIKKSISDIKRKWENNKIILDSYKNNYTYEENTLHTYDIQELTLSMVKNECQLQFVKSQIYKKTPHCFAHTANLNLPTELISVINEFIGIPFKEELLNKLWTKYIVKRVYNNALYYRRNIYLQKLGNHKDLNNNTDYHHSLDIISFNKLGKSFVFQLNIMTIPELKNICKQNNIKKYSKSPERKK